MPAAFEIALLEDPGVAALGIGEIFPGVSSASQKRKL